MVTIAEQADDIASRLDELAQRMKTSSEVTKNTQTHRTMKIAELAAAMCTLIARLDEERRNES